MLRITRMDPNGDGVVLKLEGRVADQWVDLLQDTCERHRGETGAPVTLDLSSVTSVSREGTDLFIRLRRGGVRCVYPSPYLRELVPALTHP